ncbi:MAG: phosphopyruvate hydratase [bacterium]|jgi:enolase
MTVNNNAIEAVHARQILDSKCRPIIEVDVITKGGVRGRGSASTGTSVGMYEAVVLVDNNPAKFGGKSVYKAIQNVNDVIGPSIVGLDVTNQKEIDKRMIELDGTQNKAKLGGNAIYATSVACIKAAAATKGMPLYRYLAGGPIKTLPVPTFNSINGGRYGDFVMGIQEFTFCPYKAESMAEAVEIAMRVFPMIGKVIAEFQQGRPAKVGHYYGWQPPTEDPECTMELLHEAVLRCGYENKVAYALDFASSEVYDADTKTYYMGGKRLCADEMIDLARRMTQRYNFLYIEDLLDENNWVGYQKAVQAIDRSIIIGDDFIVTNVERLKKAHAMHAVEGFVFKPNQVGTITESLETYRFAQEHNMITVPSQRGGGVIDDVVMDLCLAMQTPAVKNSAPRSGERIYACNALYRAADENPDAKLFDFTPLTRF